jgi:carboxylesterase type B
LDVSNRAAACWQNNLNTGGRLNISQSEDCLTVDIYAQPHLMTPSTQSRVPVIAWIYGGSLVHGSTNSYAGLEGLAARGDIVLVAMNYRLTAFGWLSLPELDTGDPRGVSSNRGLLDIQEALRWVQRNVHSFGGDPKKVTLLGQSSGGTAILGLLASTKSNGLFSAAISLSASPNISVDLRSAQAVFRPPVLAACNLSADAVGPVVTNCLQRLTPQRVATLLPTEFDVEPALPQSPSGQHYVGLPVVDGVTIEVPVLEALQRGMVDVPLVLQTMVAEMDTYEGNATIYSMGAAAYSRFLASSLREGGWAEADEAAARVSSLYAPQQQNSTELAYQVYLADVAFLCGHVRLAMAATTSFSSPVYLSLGMQGPSSPMHVLPNRPPCRHAGHNFDFIAVARAWDFWYQHFPPTEKFSAAVSDAEFGDNLWRQWHALAVNGTVPQAAVFRCSKETHAIGANFTINLQSTAVVHALNYAKERCATLEAAPLALGQSFWLVN